MGLCSSQSKKSKKSQQKETLKKCQTINLKAIARPLIALHRAKSSNINQTYTNQEKTFSNSTFTSLKPKRKVTKEPISKCYSIIENKYTYTKNDEYVQIQHNYTGKVRTLRTLGKQLGEDIDIEQLICNLVGSDFTSPHIANSLEIYQDHSNYYIVQEFCCGGLLNSKCGQLKEEKIFYILSQILEVFEQIHFQNWAHGDLSIDSFALLDQSNNYDIKLIDILPLFQTKKRSELLQLQLSDLKKIGPIIYQLINKKQENLISFQQIIKKLKEQPDQSELNKIIILLMETNNLDIYQTIKNNLAYQNSRQQQLSVIAGSVLKQKMKQASYLQQRLLLIMNQIFFKERQQFLENIFKKTDENGNGALSKDELHKALGEEINVDSLFKMLDNDGNGEVDLQEFLFHSCDRGALLTEFNIESTFQQIQRKGLVGSFQICKFLESDLEKLESDLQNIGEPKLNINQFKKLMKALL